MGVAWRVQALAVARSVERHGPSLAAGGCRGAAAGSGICLSIAAAAMRLGFLADPGGAGPNPYHSWARLCLFVAFFAVVTALGIMIHGLGTAVEQRRSRRPLPPGPQSTETGLARAYRGC